MILAHLAFDSTSGNWRLIVDLTTLGPMARRNVRFAPRAMNSAA
jgi:hypothetical protein